MFEFVHTSFYHSIEKDQTILNTIQASIVDSKSCIFFPPIPAQDQLLDAPSLHKVSGKSFARSM